MKNMNKKQFNLVNSINTSVHKAVTSIESYYVFDIDEDPRDQTFDFIATLPGDEATLLNIYRMLKNIDEYTASAVKYTADYGLEKPKNRKKKETDNQMTIFDDTDHNEERADEPVGEETHEPVYAFAECETGKGRYSYIDMAGCDIGDYVAVPFGKDNDLIIAQVTALSHGTKTEAPFEFSRMKQVEEILSGKPEYGDVGDLLKDVEKAAKAINDVVIADIDDEDLIGSPAPGTNDDFEEEPDWFKG